MTTPFRRAAAIVQEAPAQVQPTVLLTPQENKAVSAFKRQAEQMPVVHGDIMLPVTDEQIQMIGTEAGQRISEVASKFTELNTTKVVAEFGDLGDTLAHVALQSERLDPSNILPSGITGWVMGKIYDVKHTLIKRFKSADESFASLTETINKRVASEETWSAQYATLYDQNIQVYNVLVTELAQVKAWEQGVATAIQNLPKIDPADPDGIMKAQAYSRAEARLYRLRSKLDLFMRLKMLVETNGPKIMGCQTACQETADALREVVVSVLPIVRMDFSLLIGTLENSKSRNVVKITRNLGNQTLVKSADAVATTMIESATLHAESAITNETLNSVRQKISGAVSKVRDVRVAADKRWTIDAKTNEASQQALLAELTAQGAI